MGRSTFTELHLSDSSNEQSLSKEFPQIFDSAFEFVAIYRVRCNRIEERCIHFIDLSSCVINIKISKVLISMR